MRAIFRALDWTAACTIIDEQSGASATFYLIAPCRAERMYLDTPLFQLPNYEFCGIWSAHDYLIIRTAWASAQDDRRDLACTVIGGMCGWMCRHLATARHLPHDTAIVEATLANLPLVARTTLPAAQGKRAILEALSIKTMNLMQQPPRFQVDTGPLILPRFARATTHPIEQFEWPMSFIIPLTKPNLSCASRCR